MTSQRYPWAYLALWFAAVALAPVILGVMAIGGLLCGVVALLAIPVAGAGAAAAGIASMFLHKAPASPAPGSAEAAPGVMARPVPLRVVQALRAAVPVTVTVTSSHGTCPRGFTYRVGDRYDFNNGKVKPALCPVAVNAIRPLVNQLRQGRYPTTIKPFCATSQHEVVFNLETADVPVREPAPA